MALPAFVVVNAVPSVFVTPSAFAAPAVAAVLFALSAARGVVRADVDEVDF